MNYSKTALVGIFQLDIQFCCFLLLQLNGNLSENGEGGITRTERADSVFGLGDILEQETEEETLKYK